MPIYGDGRQIRDWLYVMDHCRALCRVLEAGRLGETYNIGGWNEKANLDMVHTLCDILMGDIFSASSMKQCFDEGVAPRHSGRGPDRAHGVRG